MPTVDFTGVSTEFEPMDEGYYPATLEAWEAGVAKTGKKGPKVDLSWEVASGEYEGRKLFRTFSMDKKALWAFKRALIRMGADEDELASAVDLEVLMPQLLGAPCVLKVGQHEWNDSTRNNIKDVYPEDFEPSDGFADSDDD